ncbi:hypothetical protein ERJ75_001629500 [Trypanosoma vivax]|nr:hypothetical protein ERJ75_001629500 [Trypanosoma vivax]
MAAPEKGGRDELTRGLSEDYPRAAGAEADGHSNGASPQAGELETTVAQDAYGRAVEANVRCGSGQKERGTRPTMGGKIGKRPAWEDRSGG